MPSELGPEIAGLRSRRFDSGGATLAETGERALLSALAALAKAAAPSGSGLVLGPGDDAAVFTPAPGSQVVVSTDATVEGRDFLRDWITPYEAGRRAAAIALSDLAAMGATPVMVLATLCAPPSTLRDDVYALAAGLGAMAAEAGCSVGGGDLSDIDGPLVIDVTVVGSVPGGRRLALGAARPGDALVVSGTLGRAAAGLAVLRGKLQPPRALAERWRSAQIAPLPRLAEGRRLLEAGVACATDLSDGLAVGAAAIAGASSCGVEIWCDELPCDPELRALPDWLALAAAGGEDFELLAAVPADLVAALIESWPLEAAPLRVIGAVTGGTASVRWLPARGGHPLPAPAPESRHYA